MNPNTVARAYRELEHDELIEKRRTTGTFVCELPKKLGVAQRRKLIAPALDKLLIQARQLGLPLDQLMELIEKRDTELQKSETRS